MNPFILINHLFYVKILIKKIGTNQNQLTENVFFFANRVSFAAEKKIHTVYRQEKHLN